MKIKFLSIAVLGAAFLTSCSDDDDTKKTLSNAYTYDGEEYKITSAIVGASDLEDGNYDLEFWSDEDQDYINIELSGEWDGKTVDLTKPDNEFEWPWSISFEQKQGEDNWIDIIDDFGSDEPEFGNIADGELYIKLIEEDENIFDVKLSVTTTEGKKFKLAYKGEFTPEGGGAARIKKIKK